VEFAVTTKHAMGVKVIKRYAVDTSTLVESKDGAVMMVDEMPVDAIQEAIYMLEGAAHRNRNTEYGHGYAVRMDERVNKLRDLLLAIRPEQARGKNGQG